MFGFFYGAYRQLGILNRRSVRESDYAVSIWWLFVAALSILTPMPDLALLVVPTVDPVLIGRTKRTSNRIVTVDM